MTSTSSIGTDKVQPDKINGSRRFYIASQSWWFRGRENFERGVADEIVFGLYAEGDDGTFGEMVMRWYHLDHHHGAVPTPRLEVFSDAWAALASLGDLLQALVARQGAPLSPLEFSSILVAHGFVDHTPRTDPDVIAAIQDISAGELEAALKIRRKYNSPPDQYADWIKKMIAAKRQADANALNQSPS